MKVTFYCTIPKTLTEIDLQTPQFPLWATTHKPTDHYGQILTKFEVDIPEHLVQKAIPLKSTTMEEIK